MKPLRILVIRRDNIGDLICTTPLLRALRCRFPQATLTVLASSYNVAVLDGNPDVDEVFVFLKRYKKSYGYSFLMLLWKRWQLVRMLRKRHFDYILLANGGWRYARQLHAKKLVGFHEKNQPASRQPDLVVSLAEDGIHDHEVSKMARLGEALGMPYNEALGPTHLFPNRQRLEEKKKYFESLGWKIDRPTIALHISSRQPQQRWRESSFVALAQQLIKEFNLQVFLLWSPGAEDNPMHPGDDAKAQRILQKLVGIDIFPAPTKDIPDLIASIALVHQMICSDGGAMHVAAALKKPLLCFFGSPSNIEEWHPWKVPYVVLRSPSKIVADLSVEEVIEGFKNLQEKVSSSTSC